MAKSTKTKKPKTRILVVDEDIDSLKKLYIGLLQLQFDVEASDQIDEIIQRINRFKPSVIIIGQEFVDREHNIYRNIKYIYNLAIIRLVHQPEIAEQQDFAVKPVRINEIAEMIRQLTKKKK
jgi:DNA-binding NtrC family response regulator